MKPKFFYVVFSPDDEEVEGCGWYAGILNNEGHEEKISPLFQTETLARFWAAENGGTRELPR